MSTFTEDICEKTQIIKLLGPPFSIDEFKQITTAINSNNTANVKDLITEKYNYIKELQQK